MDKMLTVFNVYFFSLVIYLLFIIMLSRNRETEVESIQDKKETREGRKERERERWNKSTLNT